MINPHTVRCVDCPACKIERDREEAVRLKAKADRSEVVIR